MSYNTKATEWPEASTVPDSIKQLLGRYFNLLDTNNDAVGNELAQIFTNDGKISGPGVEFEGTEAIRNCRKDAWKVITKRRHTLLRVYLFDEAATDLLIIGHVEQGLFNGKSVSGEWVARILLDVTNGTIPKIRYHQVWADAGNAQKQIKEAIGGS